MTKPTSAVPTPMVVSAAAVVIAAVLLTIAKASAPIVVIAWLAAAVSVSAVFLKVRGKS